MVSTASNNATMQNVDHFDACVWLDRYTAAGGAYVFTCSGELWFITEGMNTRAIIVAMREIAGRDDRLTAIRGLLGKDEANA